MLTQLEANERTTGLPMRDEVDLLAALSVEELANLVDETSTTPKSP